MSGTAGESGAAGAGRAGGATKAGPARRELAAAVLACAGGAGLALLAASNPWTAAERGGPLHPGGEAVDGADLLPWLSAVALVALAGAGALLAIRGTARRVLGGLITMCGAGIIVGAITQLARLGADVRPLWPVLATVGGLLVAGAGAATLGRSRHWPAMGARYERPARTADPTRPTTGSDMWDALDRGEDPTA